MRYEMYTTFSKYDIKCMYETTEEHTRTHKQPLSIIQAILDHSKLCFILQN